MPNRLANETSPYLKQHAQNPVDWYPWGKEALERSKREQKPIFLSIGYSACHWCHVMERESFEDPETARLLNEHFINIKVDREERQDLDHIYMKAVQVMTQHGGWPMSVFLTPQLEPFYGGTYFPPEDRGGMPSFRKILLGVSNAWKTKRDEVTRSANQLVTMLRQMSQQNVAQASKTALSLKLRANAVAMSQQAFDSEFGGFGAAPKFFHTMDLRVCLRHAVSEKDPTALSLVTSTLEMWSRGGIYDVLGGGFHRYSTDREWLVPHFEKMLYDNALLSQLYTEAYQATREIGFAKIAHETFDYVLREMTSPEGGFYCTQDADSEGVEGKYYVFSEEEVRKALDSDLAEMFCTVYGVTPQGNWEGTNVLRSPAPLASFSERFQMSFADLEDNLASARRKLLALRSKRVAPHRDEKILLSWNALMIDSLAYAYQVFEEERYLLAAEKAALFVQEKMRCDRTERWLHSYKDGESKFAAYLDDCGAWANALVTLYQSTFDPKWLKLASEVTEFIVSQFWDEKSATLFYTASDHEALIFRPEDAIDGATPSGSALALTALIRLGRLIGDPGLLRIAQAGLKRHEAMMHQVPMASGQLLIALDLLLDHAQEIAIIPGDNAEDWQEFVQKVRSRFLPNLLIAVKRGEAPSQLFENRKALEGKTTAYVCERFTCREPVTSVEAFSQLLPA